MNKENIVTPIIIIGLSVAFISISVLVVFFSGNPKFLKYKLKIGAAIIALTTFVNTHGFSQKTCYKPSISREIIRLNGQDDVNFIKIYKDDKKISGIIENVLSSDYLFSISDTSNKLLKKGKLVPINGKFDKPNENFEITIGNLKVGQYYLKIYSNGVDFEKESPLYNATLYILDKKEPPVLCYYY